MLSWSQMWQRVLGEEEEKEGKARTEKEPSGMEEDTGGY